MGKRCNYLSRRQLSAAKVAPPDVAMHLSRVVWSGNHRKWALITSHRMKGKFWLDERPAHAPSEQLLNALWYFKV